MSIHWGNWDVRVYAAEALVSLASRFAVEHPTIADRLQTCLADPAPAVRLQVAQNLQVLFLAAPERMWAMAEQIVTSETDAEIISTFLSNALRRLSRSEPERCEALLGMVKDRLDGDLGGDYPGRNDILESLGGWTAQLYAGQGRTLTRTWLEEWSVDPARYRDLLDAFTSSLRGAFFDRYAPAAHANACAMCDRAQEGLSLILASATTTAAEAYRTLTSGAPEDDKREAEQHYRAAEMVINHAMNQLYFGSGAHANNQDTAVGLPDAAAKSRFLSEYPAILALLGRSREPSTLHHLIELYEFLIPGNPVTVFEAIHAILLGRGEEEGYHYESLGSTAVVRIVQRYIADYRAIFEDEGRRGRLIAILQLFSEVGWPDALKLLYQLPDLFR
ncbi:hypothetical protein HDG34_006121 [Paraburkholderia sp. HC6.4b]|uniref:hypothetical protein n=1 Tax=unclassified Paraburkholderia TaxID=2615204 RepID=UPI00181AFCDD|nr:MULTISPECIES: hypothetical protein [unclassified Paraburkholderia]MBB5412150.1 hypothetical protein [Paraburkholderia sp. HC6.4b]MBB5454217.1 hypothetical protein [Paraburkholderia sp. Kb1A]